LALALAPAGMAFAAIRAGPRAPRARPLPARVPPRSARAAPACLRLAPRPGFSNADGSRPVRLRVLSPGARDEDARAVGEGGERASPPSSAPREYTSRNPKAAKSPRSASIEADLERARAAARAADDAASIAEQEHEAFLMANKLLLDARAAQAETSRAAALRAAEVAARARAAAEDAARLAAAKHELALAEAQSESCAYAVESAALRAELDESNGALTSSYGFSEPACLTNAKKAELRREATERVANAARKEHAEAAAALVRGRAEAAKAKTRAAAEAQALAFEASARAAARFSRNEGAPKLWDSFDELDVFEEENERRRDGHASVHRKEEEGTDVTRLSSTTDAGNNIVPERVRPRLRETVARDQADAAETMRRAAERAERQFVELAPRLAGAPTKSVVDDEDATGARAETGGGGTTGGGETAGGGGGGGDGFAAETTSSLYRDSASDTVAPMPEWMYPRALDCVPAFFGKLNPVTGALVYYTGAVLRESTGAPLVAAQWTFLVLVPLLAAQCFLRYKAHERDARRSLLQHEAEEAEWVSRRAEAKKSAWPGVEDDIPDATGAFVSRDLPFPFARANRKAWLDVHLGYALLCPAGAVGGEGASWWLLLAPFVMFCRFVGERFAFFKTPRRVLAVVGGAVALAAVTFSASASLTQALASLRAGGAVGVALAPFAFAATFAFYLAPAALLPGAIARAWRGEGEWAKDAKADAARLEKEARLEKTSSSDPAALEKERAKKRTWQVLGVLAMGVSLATGSDVPIFLCFFAQLLKADPGALLQVMIDKGDANRAAFDEKVADAAASAVDAMKKKGKKSDDASASDAKGSPGKGADAAGAA